ncbi:hypothetical protein H072_11536 [Dactylellina haptotyla CBS 200.50]|uniref:Uncharacterized protein n=1 Tax=Dactylellina haptotyla (strain CBS 200.50) TaxID=1284197 RepID=S8A1Q0_DACHA|nr:hypothetical protein H072_11536 [Dactylellina haptotyla CBS 200.50]
MTNQPTIDRELRTQYHSSAGRTENRAQACSHLRPLHDLREGLASQLDAFRLAVTRSAAAAIWPVANLMFALCGSPLPSHNARSTHVPQPLAYVVVPLCSLRQTPARITARDDAEHHHDWALLIDSAQMIPLQSAYSAQTYHRLPSRDRRPGTSTTPPILLEHPLSSKP